MLRDLVRARGHKVLDWTAFRPPLPDSLSPDERRALLDADESGKIYRFCSEACARADVIIYLGPAGQDAACEVGMAVATGRARAMIGLRGPFESPGTIIGRAVTVWRDDYRSLLALLDKIGRECAGRRRPRHDA